MKITLITACRNSIATIRDAIESVRHQKLPEGVELEHLIIDGGSSDGTEALATVSEPDRGMYDAINKGIRMSSGDVIGILNADDVLDGDDVIAGIADAFSDSSIDAIYADVRFVRELGGKTLRYCTGRFFRNWQFRFATFPAHPSTFVRRECFDKFGMYSLDYRICADFEMMLRLFYINHIRAKYLPICTTVMRIGGASTGGISSNIEINREDLRALRANGVWSCMPLIYLKYFAKVFGYILPGRK